MGRANNLQNGCWTREQWQQRWFHEVQTRERTVIGMAGHVYIVSIFRYLFTPAIFSITLAISHYFAPSPLFCRKLHFAVAPPVATFEKKPPLPISDTQGCSRPRCRFPNQLHPLPPPSFSTRRGQALSTANHRPFSSLAMSKKSPS